MPSICRKNLCGISSYVPGVNVLIERDFLPTAETVNSGDKDVGEILQSNNSRDVRPSIRVSRWRSEISDRVESGTCATGELHALFKLDSTHRW